MQRDPDDRIALGWQLTQDHLDEIHEASRAGDATMAVFMIPLAIQLSDAVFEQFVENQDYGPHEALLDRPQRQLPAFRARTAADPRLLYIPADGHWNEAGHALAAETLADSLIERGLVP
jgi:hypothetical protein